MGLTIGEALSMEAMDQTKIIAGKNGLNREIRWVSVIEVLDDISVLQAGDLLITTAFGLSDTPRLLKELIPFLVQRNLAGLAIQTGYYVDVIPPALIEQCNEHNLPLVELPKHIVFSDMTMAITKRIVNRQMEMLEYAQQIQERLTMVILQNKGLSQVAKVLSELINAQVRVFDAHFNLLTCWGFEADSAYIRPEKVQAEYQFLNKKKLLTPMQEAKPVFIPAGPDIPQQFLQPLIVGTERYGYISVVTDRRLLEDMERIAILSAATISTLEIVKERAVWEAEERVKGDFIDDLLENSSMAKNVLYRRANYLGFNLENKFTALAFSIDNLNSLVTDDSEESFQTIHTQLFTLVRFYLQSYRLKALLKYKNNRLIVLLQIDRHASQQSVADITESLRKAVKAETAINTIIGIGRIYDDLSDIAKSFAEAEQALSIGIRLRNRQRIFFYENLGPYTLFTNAVNTAELMRYYTQTTAALIEYDATHRGELAATLDMFCQCNNGLKETAQALYIHRHTLKYRLSRIHEITGLNPENSQDLFQLQLGLMAARLLAKL